MSLYDEISNLISLKTEGDYWDFKIKWHENMAELLHDIICMANNLVNKDAYLIIGVSDSKHPGGVQIKGVPKDNRKSQQNLIDFLKSIKFAGGIRPTVYVQTETFGEAVIDVIVIKNSNHTPFFLAEPYSYGGKCVQSGHIYTRIGDTNTPIKNVADIDKIEYLWRKRFGIDLNVNDKLLLLLDSPDDWVGDFNNSDYKYHALYPEYQIHLRPVENQDEYRRNDILKNIAAHQSDKSFSVAKIEITYHATILFSDIVIYLDGYRHLIPFPKTETIYHDSTVGAYDIDDSLTYLYFEMGSVPGKLFYCLAKADQNWYCEKWDLRPGVAFLTFDDKSEREDFNRFVLPRLEKTLDEYEQCLLSKGYVNTIETAEYFYKGWSKGNEIKSWYLYEQFIGNTGWSLDAMIPSLLK